MLSYYDYSRKLTQEKITLHFFRTNSKHKLINSSFKKEFLQTSPRNLSLTAIGKHIENLSPTKLCIFTVLKVFIL